MVKSCPYPSAGRRPDTNICSRVAKSRHLFKPKAAAIVEKFLANYGSARSCHECNKNIFTIHFLVPKCSKIRKRLLKVKCTHKYKKPSACKFCDPCLCGKTFRNNCAVCNINGKFCSHGKRKTVCKKC